MGLHASATGELIFQDVRIPSANLLGERGTGFRTFLKILDGGRISIGALAVGLAQAALDAAIPYAQTREQFGRPIGTFQGVLEDRARRWPTHGGPSCPRAGRRETGGVGGNDEHRDLGLARIGRPVRAVTMYVPA